MRLGVLAPFFLGGYVYDRFLRAALISHWHGVPHSVFLTVFSVVHPPVIV